MARPGGAVPVAEIGFKETISMNSRELFVEISIADNDIYGYWGAIRWAPILNTDTGKPDFGDPSIQVNFGHVNHTLKTLRLKADLMHALADAIDKGPSRWIEEYMKATKA